MEWNNKEKKTPLVRTSNASARRNICKTGSQRMWEKDKKPSRKAKTNMAETNKKANWGNETELPRHWNTNLWQVFVEDTDKRGRYVYNDVKSVTDDDDEHKYLESTN